jgi:hypothetical protein
MATLKALKALLSKNYLRVVAHEPGLRAAFFHDARELFDYSPAIKLLLLLMLTK